MEEKKCTELLPSKSCAGIRDNVSYNRNLTNAIGAFKC